MSNAMNLQAMNSGFWYGLQLAPRSPIKITKGRHNDENGATGTVCKKEQLHSPAPFACPSMRLYENAFWLEILVRVLSSSCGSIILTKIAFGIVIESTVPCHPRPPAALANISTCASSVRYSSEDLGVNESQEKNIGRLLSDM